MWLQTAPAGMLMGVGAQGGSGKWKMSPVCVVARTSKSPKSEENRADGKYTTHSLQCQGDKKCSHVNKFHFNSLHVFIVGAHVWRSKDNLLHAVHSLSTVCGSWAFNSGRQPWRQLPLPSELSRHPQSPWVCDETLASL